MRGLSRVSWEKIDVSFQSSRQRFAAHSVIQVLSLSGVDKIIYIMLMIIYAVGSSY